MIESIDGTRDMMGLKNLTQGSSLLMLFAVAISATVLVSAYTTFSNNVWTDQEDFGTMMGITISLEDVEGTYPNYSITAEESIMIDTIYDQGLRVTSTNYTGHFHIEVSISSSTVGDIMDTDISTLQVKYEYDVISDLVVNDLGNYLIGYTGSMPITEGAVYDLVFLISFSAEANDYVLEFTPVADGA